MSYESPSSGMFRVHFNRSTETQSVTGSSRGGTYSCKETSGGTYSCKETSSIPNLRAEKPTEYKLTCRSEQAIYDMFEHFENQGMRVERVACPAWLVRVARGMSRFCPNTGPVAQYVGSIFGTEFYLKHVLKDTVEVYVVQVS